MYNNLLINNNLIINGFNHAGIINKFYLSSEEEKIREGYLYDLLPKEKNEIISKYISKKDQKNIDSHVMN